MDPTGDQSVSLISAAVFEGNIQCLRSLKEQHIICIPVSVISCRIESKLAMDLFCSLSFCSYQKVDCVQPVSFQTEINALCRERK